MKKQLLSALTLAALIGSVNIAAAQTATPSDPGHPVISHDQKRIDNQQQRLNEGIQNGSVTPEQAAKDQARINNMQNTINEASASGGSMTKKEAVKTHRQLHRNSKHLARQKNGPATPPVTTEPAAQ